MRSNSAATLDPAVDSLASAGTEKVTMLTAASAWPLEDSSCSMIVPGTLNRSLRLSSLPRTAIRSESRSAGTTGTIERSRARAGLSRLGCAAQTVGGGFSTQFLLPKHLCPGPASSGSVLCD